MNRFNLYEAQPEYDPSDPEGYRAGMDRFGPKIGATQLGATVYELPPGQSICPYHYEYPEEEWLIVLAGRVILRTPGGEEELATTGNPEDRLMVRRESAVDYYDGEA
jgi:uncharacterized cupin superfamily protein